MKKFGGLEISEHCTTCVLRRKGFFCELGKLALKELDEVRVLTTFPAGALLFTEGQDPQGVYIVCQGKVKMYTNSRDGKTMIVRLAGPGDVIGVNSTITSRPYETSAAAMESSQIVFVPGDRFRSLLGRHPDAAVNSALALSKACVTAYNQIRSLGLSGSAREKLAMFLLNMIRGTDVHEDEAKVRLVMTHEEIAQTIGSSRETVTRLFTDMKHAGLLEIHGSMLVIKHKSLLEKIVNV